MSDPAPAKLCPKCRQTSPLDAQWCWQCGHQFRTKFDSHPDRTQLAMPPMPQHSPAVPREPYAPDSACAPPPPAPTSLSAPKFNVRSISPALIVLALLCFFMPFLTVSCSNSTVRVLSGNQLAFGEFNNASGQAAAPAPSLPPELSGMVSGLNTRPDISPKDYSTVIQPLVVTAALLAIVALGFSVVIFYVPRREVGFISATFCVLSGICLLVLKTRIDNDILAAQRTSPFLSVQYGPGFWASLFLLVASALVSFVLPAPARSYD